MTYLLNKYRDWCWSVSDTAGDLMACAGYVAWCASLAGALFAFKAGAFVPMLACLGVAGLLTISVYIP
jgi:hypothetical protein